MGFRPTIVEDFGSALECRRQDRRCQHGFRASRTVRARRACRARRSSVRRRVRSPTTSTSPTRSPTRACALSEIAKLLGIPLAEIAVIGDGGNDVAMFERAVSASPWAMPVRRCSEKRISSRTAIATMALPTRSSGSSSVAAVRMRGLRRRKREIAHGRARSRRIENLACPGRRRRHARHCGESADAARGSGREGSPNRRHRLCDYQRPAAARHGDADRSVGAANPGRRVQRRDFRQARHDHHGRARACRRRREARAGGHPPEQHGCVGL